MSPNRKRKDDDVEDIEIKPMNMFAGARAFKDMFDEAMQGGIVEVRVVLTAGTFAQKCYRPLDLAAPVLLVGCGVRNVAALSKRWICGFRHSVTRHITSSCLCE